MAKLRGDRDRDRDNAKANDNFRQIDKSLSPNELNLRAERWGNEVTFLLLGKIE